MADRIHTEAKKTATPFLKLKRRRPLLRRYPEQIEPETISFANEEPLRTPEQANQTSSSAPPAPGHHFGQMAIWPGGSAHVQRQQAIGQARDQSGQVAEESGKGKRLLAHELTHVLQQDTRSVATSSIQRQPKSGATVVNSASINSPADLSPGRYKVVIVGSPGEAEIRNKHPFQFVDAAARLGTDKQTVWLIERTGYERGGVALDNVRSRAGAAHVFWIDQTTTLGALLNQFPDNSIESLDAYSHGLPGFLTLRHGWPGIDDYGLTTTGARSLSPRVFTQDSHISFDSCNSATDGDASLAQSVANATQRPVGAWTGRTSYRAVNRGEGGVSGSEIFPGDSLRPDWTELGSQLRGRNPQKITVAPTSSPGSFTSTYAITARLPESRQFPVRQGQTVNLKIDAVSEYKGLQGYHIWVLLHRKVNNWFDDDIGKPKQFTVGGGTATFSWSSLSAGNYYLEIYHLNGVLVTGAIAVTIQ